MVFGGFQGMAGGMPGMHGFAANLIAKVIFADLICSNQGQLAFSARAATSRDIHVVIRRGLRTRLGRSFPGARATFSHPENPA